MKHEAPGLRGKPEGIKNVFDMGFCPTVVKRFDKPLKHHAAGPLN